MKVAVYDPIDGAILRIVTLPVNRDPQNQARDGEAAVVLPEGFTGNDLTHRIEDGEPVPT